MSALWLGDAVEQAILWLLDTFRWFFDGISTVMTVLVEAISAALLGLPPAAWLVLFAAAAFFAGGWRLSGYTVLAFALIWSL